MRLKIAMASACLSAVALWAATATADPARASVRKHTEIPAQALGSALQALAKQREFQIVCRADLVVDMYAQPISGELTSDEALQRLLAGTNLTYRYLDDKTITIVPSGDAPSAARAPRAGEKISAIGRNGMVGGRLARADAAVAGGSAVQSQADKQSPGAVDSAQGGQVEEVVVTAQKRTERLIDAPQSVTVLSADTLASLGATQLRDFAATIPGLSFQTAGPGWTQISLRGVTAGFDVSPTVGIYVDDVPYGSTTSFARAGQLALDVAPYDLERIEVLRGPQGTLYGASTMGGLIKYVTKRPDTANFGGFGTLGISGTQRGGTNYNVVAGVNAPLSTDRVALRATGFQTHDDGYIDNVTLGRKDVNSSDVYGGRLDLLFTPSDNLSIRLNSFLQNTTTDGFPLSDRTLAGAPVRGDLVQARPAEEAFKQRFRLVAGTVSYDFGAAELTSISSYQTVRTHFDVDLSPVFLAFAQSLAPGGVTLRSAVSDIDSSTDKFTQELRLSSKSGGVLEWILGAYYTDESSKDTSHFLTVDTSGQTVPNNILFNLQPSEQKEYAAFGDLTWRLTGKFDVTGGVRYAHTDTTFTQFQSGALGLNAPRVDTGDHIFTYLGNVRYRFTDRATGYLRYATSYRPGGPNFILTDPATGRPLTEFATFDPDELKSYEIGFKADTADRRFGIDIGVYTIDWSNIQVTVSRSGLVFRDNATGGATSRGADLTFSARPTHALLVTGNFAYQDAFMKEANTVLRVAKGERLPNVPHFTTAWNADYQLGTGSLQPVIGATVRYVGDRTASYNASTSPPQYRLQSYTTVDLRLGLQLGSFNTQLYAHNLLDEYGEIPPRLSGVTPATGPYAVGIIQPRTIGLMISRDF